VARNTLTAFVAAVLVFLFSVSCGNAGDAVISSDNERVYLIGDIESKPAVEEIDLNKKKARKILLAQLESSDGLRGITCTHKNRFFCTTAKAVWSFEGEMEMLHEPKERFPIYQTSLQSLEILGQDSRAEYICVSLDETRVHYVLHDKHWLVTNGRTDELHLANNDSSVHRH
jgi:hypothetical protein